MGYSVGNEMVEVIKRNLIEIGNKKSIKTAVENANLYQKI